MTEARQSFYFRLALIVVLALAAARIAVIAFSGLNLYPDEAQYWVWSREPDFGYFSKPPVLAWIIGLTTSLCGQEEFCIRIGSPLLHAATSLAVFALGRMLYDARTGFWAALIHATLPAVFCSAAMISTDVPLLFFWTLALIGFWRMTATPGWGWALFTGAAVGLGFMSKYAMSYFLAGAVLFAAFDPAARARLFSLRTVAALFLAAAIFAPNVWWNLKHDFATLSHTAANANWTADALINPGNLLKFLGDQFLVFGPLLFGALLLWLTTARRRLAAGPAPRQDLFLLCFTLPPLAIVAAQAFISRANANWAATAYIAATVLVTAWLLRAKAGAWLKTSVGLHAVIGLLIWFTTVSPDRGQALFGVDLKPIREMRGWDLAASRITAPLREGDKPYTAVLTDDRFVHASLAYYMRDAETPLRAWKHGDRPPQDHFQMTAPLTRADDDRVLLVSRTRRTPRLLERFEHARFIDTIVLDVGRGRTRSLRLYEVSGLKDEGDAKDVSASADPSPPQAPQSPPPDPQP